MTIFTCPLVTPHNENTLSQTACPSGELAAFAGSCARVAIVGHEPDFSGLVEYLLGTRQGYVRVKKASVILLNVNPPHPGGVMQFNVWPAMLPG